MQRAAIAVRRCIRVSSRSCPRSPNRDDAPDNRSVRGDRAARVISCRASQFCWAGASLPRGSHRCFLAPGRRSQSCPADRRVVVFKPGVTSPSMRFTALPASFSVWSRETSAFSGRHRLRQAVACRASRRCWSAWPRCPKRCSGPPAAPAGPGSSRLCLGRVREGVEGDVELPGEEVAASELRAHPPLLDQALNKGVALSEAPLEGFADGSPFGSSARRDVRGRTRSPRVLEDS